MRAFATRAHTQTHYTNEHTALLSHLASEHEIGARATASSLTFACSSRESLSLGIAQCSLPATKASGVEEQVASWLELREISQPLLQPDDSKTYKHKRRLLVLLLLQRSKQPIK